MPGRCKATNLCDYCAKLAAVENTHLLTLDALHGNAPTVVAILGTRTAGVDMARFYGGRRELMRALRARWPQAEYAALLEFTTGYGPRSGGKRRPHWNLLLKGIPDEDLDQAREIIVRVWCANVAAKPQAQYVGRLRDAGGFMRYVALHFQKQSQSPPKGFSGHRFTASRGYLWLPTPEARVAARDSLQRDRFAHAVEKDAPELDPATVHDVVEQLMVLRAAETWRRVDMSHAVDPLPTRSRTAPTPAAGDQLNRVPGGGTTPPRPARMRDRTRTDARSAPRAGAAVPHSRDDARPPARPRSPSP